MKKISYTILSLIFLLSNSYAQIISNNGNNFVPDTLYVNLGDTIYFNITNNHNAVEVSENTWNSNGTTTNNGFNIPFGGGNWIVDSVKTYYYVCQPHAAMGMKGVIISNPTTCNKNVTQALTGFDPQPVYNPWIWAYDTLTLTNTSNCDLRVRPEFEISLDNGLISMTDFDLKWYNPLMGSWPSLPYQINSSGNAVGYWGIGGDTTGQIMTQSSSQQIIIRVRFKTSANYGNYCAIWKTNEVDVSGNIIQNLVTSNPICLGLVDCANFSADSIYSSNISCFNANDGNASIQTIQGGSGSYNYLWNNGDTTNIIDNLNAGNYYCVVKDKNWQQCSDSISFSISEPNPITNIIDSASNISTYGGNDGYIYITTNGGVDPINITWNSNNGFSSNDTSITNITAGIYYLEITDSNNCVYIDTIEISQPSSLSINLDVSTNASCFDSCNGALNIIASGGDSSYTYIWSGPNGFTSTDSNITNLCNGIYIVTVNDGITTLTDTFNIYQPQEMTSNLVIDSILCHNGISQAEINVWGGTQPLSYNWSNGDSNYITNISAGNYSIIVTDQNGCSINQSFSLTNPDSIISTTTSYAVNCFGGNDGSVIINTIGNSGICVFSKDNGVTYQSSNIFNSLSAGNYTFLVSDTNNCLSSTYANVIEPDQITSITSSIDASCYGYCDGNVSVTAIGGSPPYSYVWTNGINNLCAGFYNVTITDNNGCVAINSAIVNEPNPMLVNVWINGAKIMATSNFSGYQWFYANGDPIPGATTEIFEPTSVGEYYVIVTNGNCQSTSYIISYNISNTGFTNKEIKIYPNPSNGLIVIEAMSSIKNVTIMNYKGNQLFKVENNHNKSSINRIDLSNFTKGIYFIKIEQKNQIINHKIVLQ